MRLCELYDWAEYRYTPFMLKCCFDCREEDDAFKSVSESTRASPLAPAAPDTLPVLEPLPRECGDDALDPEEETVCWWCVDVEVLKVTERTLGVEDAEGCSESVVPESDG